MILRPHRLPLLLSLALAGVFVPSAPAAPDPALPLAHRATALCRAGDTLAVAGSVGLSLRNGDQEEASVWTVLPGGCVELAYAHGQYYVSCGPRGLAILDPGAAGEPPVLREIWRTPGAVYDAADAGEGRLLIADGVMGLSLVRVLPQGGVKELSRLDPGIRARGVAVEGERAFVAAGADGVLALRFSGDQIEIVGRLATREARQLALFPGGERGVLADGAGGVALLDVSSATPRLLDRLERFGVDRVRAVAVGGGLVASGEGSSGVRFLRVTAEGKFEELSRLSGLAGEVTDLLLEGEGQTLRAILAADRAGVLIVDLSDPAHPRLQ